MKINFRIFLVLLILLFIAIQSWFIYLTIRFPYLGINVSETETGEWFVSSFDKDGVHNEIDIRVGDTIVSIDGTPANEYFTIIKWESLEQADTIQIRRDGIDSSLSTKHINNALKLSILPLVAETICFLIAIILLKKIQNSRSAKLLAYVFFSVGGTFMGLIASIRGDALGKFVISSFMVFIPVLFMHFLIAFFKEKGNKQLSPKLLKYMYTIAAISLIVRLSFFFEGKTAHILYRISFVSSIVFFIICISVVFGILLKLYYEHRKENSYLSTIIRVVWIALLISFSPIVAFSFIPRIFMKTEWVSSLYSGWVVLIFPLSFAYLILTRQLYDIHVVLRRILFTVILSVVPSTVIVVINAMLFHQTESLKYYVFSFFIVLGIFTFVLYSAEHMYTRLERIMFPRKHFLQAALKKISKNLTSTSSFRDLKDLILVDIVNTMQVYGGAIVFRYRDSIEMIREGTIDQSDVEQFIESGTGAYDDHPDLMCFEINRHEEYTSYLIMTQKKSNTKLGLEEVQWLGLIISYLAVSLENVYLIRKLTVKLNRLASQLPNEQEAYDFNWFRKLTFELQEQERVRIAADLHDTTMQDLFFLKRKLTALGERKGLPADAKETINGLIDYIEIINVNLRQSCFDLNPYLLQEIGLVRTIEKIIERESFSSPFQIRFDASGAIAVERRDLETKRHIFRIVQELINNAKKHSEAAVISLRLTTISGQVVLHYQDDGVGFDPEEMSVPDIGTSGVGIEQLRSRVLHLNGQLELDAHQGKGVSIRISFPMKGGKTA